MPNPPRITPEMIRLYDDFTHRTFDRRALMTGLTRLAGSSAAAVAALSLIEADPAAAAQVEADDPRLSTSHVQWPVADGRIMKGYLALPKPMPQRLPSIVIVHENRGLNGYIEDVARRAALAGFVALAPDFLTPFGGTPADEDQAREMIGKLNAAHTIVDAVATLDWLRHNPRVSGKVGTVGFCWGGGLVNRIAVAAGERLDAGVAFYGPTPPPADATRVKAAMMLHYAGLDQWVNKNAPAWVAALQAAGVDVQSFTYPDVEHAFHNDTSAARYNAEAANLAWDRTIAFFHEKLESPAPAPVPGDVPPAQ